MANLNKVILIGRLTRDPEMRAFNNGGRVAKFGFAVTNRRKNSQTGEWEDEPMFIDCEAYNRGETGKLADTVERFCHKGTQICIEGKLHLDQWQDQQGNRRSKHKLVVDNIQLLEPRADGAGGEGEGVSRPARSSAPARSNGARPAAPSYADADEPQTSGGGEEDIPF